MLLSQIKCHILQHDCTSTRIDLYVCVTRQFCHCPMQLASHARHRSVAASVNRLHELHVM